MTNRKSHTRFRLVPKSSTLDDLERPKRTVAEKMHLLEPTAQIWMKTDPYYQRQKCRPMILVSGNIRFMGTLEGVTVGGGIKWEWGWRRRQFFGDLSGYFLGIFKDKASNIIWLYATPCRPVTDCKMNDLEWLFWRQNPFSASIIHL